VIDHQLSHAPAQMNEALFKAQLQDLQALQNLLGTTDESSLRDMFDYPNMLRFNIAEIKRNLAPKLMSENDLRALDAFDQHAQRMISLKYGRLIRPNPDIGPLKVVTDKGQVTMINLSKQYLDAKARLTPFTSSVDLPEAVTNAVAAFNDTLQANLDLLLDTLNQDLREDPNLIIHDADPTSPYHHIATDRYWSRFQPLEPKADKVVAAIRAQLKTD
jgi:hypothetical protein